MDYDTASNDGALHIITLLCYTSIESFVLWLYVCDGQSVCLSRDPVRHSKTIVDD
jgi:hypothetical protein